METLAGVLSGDGGVIAVVAWGLWCTYLALSPLIEERAPEDGCPSVGPYADVPL